MVDTLTQFAAKWNALERSYEQMPRQMVTAAANVYTTAIRGTIGAVAPSGRLRGVGKYNGGKRKGAKIGVSYNVRGSVALVQASGPLHLIERDTKAHDIPRATRARRARTRSGRLSHKRIDTGKPQNQRIPLKIGDRWITGPVHHRGTKGKHPFERGVTVADVPAQLAAETVHTVALARLFT